MMNPALPRNNIALKKGRGIDEEGRAG